MSRVVLDRTLDQIAERFNGELGYAVRNLHTGEAVLRNEHALFPTASTCKVPVMIEVLRQVEEGRASLDLRIPMTVADKTRGSGVLKDLDAGVACTLRDLMMLMIVVSDNTATNMLIDLVGGIEPINTAMRDLGYAQTTLHGEIDFDIDEWHSRLLAEASPANLKGMMAGIATDTIVSPAACALMRDVLGRQHYLDQVPRYLDFNPYGAEFGEQQPLWIGNKNGAFPGMRADCGIIRLRDEIDIAFAVMNDKGPDSGPNWENASEIVNGVLGRLFVDYWWPEDAVEPAPILDSPYLARYLE